MCGIAGIVSLDPGTRAEPVLRRMLACVAHRGPDDEGLAMAGAAIIGARRLSVIDLTGGHQPMTNEDGSVLAVQNGEIYNFVAVRRELESHGHRFRSRNDTEILPHAYEEWGDGLAQHLRGMFAFAIWSEREQRLLLGRDRLGKKPLAYAAVGDSLIFASEIQALLLHPLVGRAIDETAIDHYLSLGYVPAPRTGFAAVRKLRPAHVLSFKDGRVHEQRYWEPRFQPDPKLSLDAAVSELRARIEDAVAVRLISDVPLGAFLSGGLDSSTVVAFMSRHSERPVKTFSIGFRDQAFDELRFARIVAERFGTDHHEYVVDAVDADVLPMLARHIGEPFADSSIVPTYQVARLTRQHVTVALNGDGGDELFAGYDRYRAAALAVIGPDRLPSWVRALIATAARALPQNVGVPRSLLRARRFLSALDQPAPERYLHWTGYFTGATRAGILGPALRQRASGGAERVLATAAELMGARGIAERNMASDLLVALPNDLLAKMDIATMAASLEGRSPLLDHELVEFTLRVPTSYKLSPTRTKILLRRAMTGILPDEILRRDKMGFTAPVGHWIRGPLRPMFEDLLGSSLAVDRGLLDKESVAGLLRRHVSGRADLTRQLWGLLMLELWLREVVCEPIPDGPNAYHRTA